MNRNDTYAGSRRATGMMGNQMKFGGYRQPKMTDEKLDKFITEQATKKNERIEYNILQQIDKSYVLCIDPETKLPFMINMD